MVFVKTWRGLQPAPRTLTAAQSHPRPPCDVPRTLAASAKLAAQSWRSSRNCRTSDRRKHVQPSFHSICAMIAQTEAQLRQLRFITGKLKLQQHTCPSSGG